MASVRSLKLTIAPFGCIRNIEDYPKDIDGQNNALINNGSRFLRGSLDMVTALYWRVRKLRVVASSFIAGPDQPQRTDDFIMPIGSLNDGTTNVNSELDLLCSTFDAWIIPQMLAPQTELDSSENGVWIDTSTNPATYLAQWRIDDGETFDSVFDEGYGTIGTWQISFSGYSISKPLYAIREDSGPASVTMEAVEYWPYDPGDGIGPIYDSTTGAQLRDFPLT